MPNNDDGPKPPPQPQLQQLSKPNEKSVYLWSKPVETQGSPTAEGGQQEDGQAQQRRNPTIANAVATIKKEDFSKVVQTPCARQGLVAGIAFGAAFGGLSLVIRGMLLAPSSPTTISLVQSANIRCPTSRLRPQIGQLGRGHVRGRQRGIIRVLPIPATGGAAADEAQHRGRHREKKRGRGEQGGGAG